MVANVKSLLRIDRAEMELRESQEYYRRIIDTALEGVWTIDAGATTTYVNRQMAAMLGRSAADMIGRSLYDFMERDARVEAKRAFERARQGLKEQRDVRFQRADGTDFWAIASTHPIFAEDGQFAGALVLITDITDRKRAERADREAETLRSVATLAAAVSHEINNPLMAVMINLELLERTHRLDAYGRERLEAALAAADEIKEKVRRFGLISQLELANDGPYLSPMLDLEKSSQGLCFDQTSAFGEERPKCMNPPRRASARAGAGAALLD
jgi:PAS domain S-box-containing protein